MLDPELHLCVIKNEKGRRFKVASENLRLKPQSQLTQQLINHPVERVLREERITTWPPLFIGLEEDPKRDTQLDETDRILLCIDEGRTPSNADSGSSSAHQPVPGLET